VQGSANAIAPGKRPLSSMTPTIVLKDGRAVLIVGASGGSRIITTVLEVMVNVIDHGLTLQDAVDAPRFHHQWLPDTLASEPLALSTDTVAALARMGYHLVPLQPWGAGNAVEAIGIAPENPTLAAVLQFARSGMFYGAADQRAPAGLAIAPWRRRRCERKRRCPRNESIWRRPTHSSPASAADRWLAGRGWNSVEEFYDSSIERVFRADHLKPIFLDQLL
jgi:hypothetical protein